MVFGYVFISKRSQKLKVQIKALLEYGVKEENIFIDDIVLSSESDVKKWDLLLTSLKAGDTLVTWKI